MAALPRFELGTNRSKRFVLPLHHKAIKVKPHYINKMYNLLSFSLDTLTYFVCN